MSYEIWYDKSCSEWCITCLMCNKTSYNSNDRIHKYCGHCNMFHEESYNKVIKVYKDQSKSLENAKKATSDKVVFEFLDNEVKRIESHIKSLENDHNNRVGL